MLEQFLTFIKKENLGDKSKRYLLTISGGIDSAVMCHLFHQAGFSFGIAHCNFKLRGKESDADEKFVNSLAKKYHVPFCCKRFNTKSYSETKGISVQMAARKLRYEWLSRLCRDLSYGRKKNAKEKRYDFIATAHHLDDSVETFFINILRGTGIAGLQGIPVKQENIIRPLLFANKKMIRQYAEKESLSWREDSSNLTDKYLRNTIRNHLLPSLKKLNTGFEKTIVKELSYFKEAGDVLKKFVEEKKKEIVEEEGKDILLSIKKLKDSGHAKLLLHELLRAYDFTPETTELIAQRMYTTAGRKFFSPTFRIIKDRDFFILTPRNSFRKSEEFFLHEGEEEFIYKDIRLKTEIIYGNISEIKEKTNTVAYLDYSQLKFPIKIRKWLPGDYFYPLGMSKRKKLSDFLIDKKIPLTKKESIYLLESERKIAWIINYRIDDRFKVKQDTKKILKIASEK